MQNRYWCQPRTGSIYTAPDIPVVRGPTLVILRGEREPYQVPAIPQYKTAKANVHDHEGADESAMLLKRLMAGIKPGYQRPGARPAVSFERKPLPLSGLMRPVEIRSG